MSQFIECDGCGERLSEDSWPRVAISGERAVMSEVERENWGSGNYYPEDPHYRLYRSPDDQPVVICVQYYDYFNYDEDRFLSGESWLKEHEAQDALRRFKATEKGALDGAYAAAYRTAAGSGVVTEEMVTAFHDAYWARRHEYDEDWERNAIRAGLWPS